MMNGVKQAALGCWYLIVVGTLLTFCVAVYEGLYYGPFKDMWWMMPMVERYFSGQLSWQELLDVHGGAHRLLIPKLLFLMEYGIFSGTNRFLVGTSLCVQAVAFGIWFSRVRSMPWSRSIKLFVWGLLLLVSFSGMQLENVLYTFDCQWFLANTFSLLAILCFVRACHQEDNLRWLLLALCSGVAASFCSFLGLCSLLLVLLGSCLPGMPMRRGIWFQLSILLFVSWYVSGLESGAYASFGGMTEQWNVGGALYFLMRLLQWTLIYLGSPLSREVQPLGMLFAFMALSYLLLECRSLYFEWRAGSLSSESLFFVLVALYAVAVAVATGLGRLYFINTADEDRYQTINLTFWLAWWLLVLGGFNRMKRPMVWPIMCMAIWGVYVGCVWHVRDILARLPEFERVQASSIAQVSGVLDFVAVRDTLILGDKTQFRNRAQMHDAFLRERQWGAHASPQAAMMRKQAMNVNVPDCVFLHTHGDQLSSGHWLFSGVTQPLSGDWLMYDSSGVARGGLVSGAWQHANWTDLFKLAPGTSEWLGYANIEQAPVPTLDALLFQGSEPQCKAVIRF
jgi:hypothetical protein